MLSTPHSNFCRFDCRKRMTGPSWLSSICIPFLSDIYQYVVDCWPVADLNITRCFCNKLQLSLQCCLCRISVSNIPCVDRLWMVVAQHGNSFRWKYLEMGFGVKAGEDIQWSMVTRSNSAPKRPGKSRITGQRRESCASAGPTTTLEPFDWENSDDNNFVFDMSLFDPAVGMLTNVLATCWS